MRLGAAATGALWLALTSVVAGLGQERIISFDKSADNLLQLAGERVGGKGGSKAGQILVSGDEYWGVIRAAGDLALDFGRVTGTNYTLSNGDKKAKPAAYVYKPVNNMNNTHVSCLGRPKSH